MFETLFYILDAFVRKYRSLIYNKAYFKTENRVLYMCIVAGGVNCNQFVYNYCVGKCSYNFHSVIRNSD